MKQLDYIKAAPEAVRPLFDMGKALESSGLEPRLLNLVQIRASQLNGCAFCLALHVREARMLGENDDRLMGIAAWREASWYNERERIALEWTDRYTNLGPDNETLLDRALEHFTERELVFLTLAVATINAWNRFNVAFHTPPELAEQTFRALHPQAAYA